MILLLSIVAALIPAFIYIGVIYWFDRYEKEPAYKKRHYQALGEARSQDLLLIRRSMPSYSGSWRKYAPFSTNSSPACISLARWPPATFRWRRVTSTTLS